MSDHQPDAGEALQHAAIKAIDAMRGLLDAAEDLVADPKNLSDVVSGVSDWTEKLADTFNVGVRDSAQADGIDDDATHGRCDEGGDGHVGQRDDRSTGAKPASPIEADDNRRLRHIPLD